MSSELKVERSFPVSSRVDITALAKLASYYEINGVQVPTMSSLVSWSIDLLVDGLVSMGKMKHRDLSLREAYEYLASRNLVQRHTIDKRKLQKSLGFENLRNEGWDPKDYAKQSYSTMHSRQQSSVKPDGVQFPSHKQVIDDDEWEQIQQRIKEETIKEQKVLQQQKRVECDEPSPQGDEGSVVKEGMTSEELYLKEKRKREEWEKALADDPIIKARLNKCKE